MREFNVETAFTLSSNSGSSSLLMMTDLHKYSYTESANLTTLHLPCHRLDDYIKQQNLELNPNILLKLDVQGAEMLILRGATDILSKTLLVFIEANFNKLYTDSILISNLVLFFKSIGFRMAGERMYLRVR